MRYFLLGCAAVLSVVLGGCLSEHDCFEIQVKPEGQAFQRKLTCWHVGGPDNKSIRPLGPAEVARIGNLYPKPAAPTDAKKHIFTGRFHGGTPRDLGGAGSYTHFTSSLGSTSCYVERFRGDDDLASQLSKRREKADRLADFVVGWMNAEVGQDPNFPRLKEFLDVNLRRDLKNLAVYAWASAVTLDRQPHPNNEWLVRVAQYFSERGYFSPQQLPSLIRADQDPKPLLCHIQRFLARKMGIADDRPVPASMAFLGDLPRLKTSFGKYARSSEPLRKRPEASKSQKGNALDVRETTPDQLADELLEEPSLDLAELTEMRIGFGSDSLEVKLVCAPEPYATNGKWDGEGAVTWSTTLCSDGTLPVVYFDLLPVVCFALWSTPDRPFQEKHFGKVLLTGESLAGYVTWQRSLGPDEATEWDQFLGRLHPGPNLKTAVGRFRFRMDPKPDPKKPKEEPASLADTPRQLILTALKEKNRG